MRYDYSQGFKIADNILSNLGISNFPYHTSKSEFKMNDDWVYVLSNEYFAGYYNSSSVKIDNKNYIIKLWVKTVYTTEGEKTIINKIGVNFTDINHSLGLHLLDYKQWNYMIINLTYYAKSGNVLSNNEYPPKWNKIISDSVINSIFNKVLNDYNIQR